MNKITNYIMIDSFPDFCYSLVSDRSAETCEARRRGRTYGSLPLFYLQEKKWQMKKYL